MKKHIQNPAVAATFGGYPKNIRVKLLRLRELIFEVAAATPGVGAIEETLKWGEPAYLTTETKSGSTIRIAWKRSQPDRYSMFFICTTNLVETFRSLFPGDFEYEGNRAINFTTETEIPEDSMRFCITAALTYRLRDGKPKLTHHAASELAGAQPMHVTRLLAPDAPRYRALMLLAYAAAPDAFTSTPEERATEPDSWWRARLEDPKGLSEAFAAVAGGELVGAVTVEFSAKPKTRHKAHLIGMFVTESARGLGAGRALVEAALGAAAARPGVQVVTLTVTEGNESAIKLYQACGFVSFGVEPMAIATPGGFRSKVHMWLKLTRGAAA